MEGKMIDLDHLERLVALLEASGVHEMELEVEGTRVRLVKPPPAQAVGAIETAIAPQAPSPPAEAQPADEPSADDGGDGASLQDVEAPMVGTFYRSPSPNAPPYVRRGARVEVGDTLCIIEAMKLMNELEAEVAGTVAEICLENGMPVEYGQVLFRIDPD